VMLPPALGPRGGRQRASGGLVTTRAIFLLRRWPGLCISLCLRGGTLGITPRGRLAATHGRSALVFLDGQAARPGSGPAGSGLTPGPGRPGRERNHAGTGVHGRGADFSRAGEARLGVCVMLFRRCGMGRAFSGRAFVELEGLLQRF